MFEVRIWDIKSGNPEIHALKGHGGSVSSVAISPEEDLIASGGDETKVLLYGLHDGIYNIGTTRVFETSNAL